MHCIQTPTMEVMPRTVKNKLDNFKNLSYLADGASLVLYFLSTFCSFVCIFSSFSSFVCFFLSVCSVVCFFSTHSSSLEEPELSFSFFFFFFLLFFSFFDFLDFWKRTKKFQLFQLQLIQTRSKHRFF